MNWYGGKSVMKRKGLVIAGLVAGLSVLTSMTAFAGEWSRIQWLVVAE